MVEHVVLGGGFSLGASQIHAADAELETGIIV